MVDRPTILTPSGHERLLEHRFEDDTSAEQWFSENIWKPAYNSGIAQPWNAVAGLVNAPSEAFTGYRLAGTLEKYSLKPTAVGSGDWFAQTTAGGIAAVLPYAAAGKMAGAGMRTVGARLELGGTAARLATNEHFAQVVGAALYDGAREPGVNETRLGNMLGGAAAFGIFGYGNSLAQSLPLADRLVARAYIGAQGGKAQFAISELVSNHQLPLSGQLIDAAWSGATMNLVLPAVHRAFGEVADSTNRKLGRGVPVDLFARSEFSRVPPELIRLIGASPFSRVRVEPGQGPFIDHASNTIVLPVPDSQLLGHELAHRIAVRDPGVVKLFDEAEVHLRNGDRSRSWDTFKEGRVLQERLALETQRQIAEALGEPLRAGGKQVAGDGPSIEALIADGGYLDRFRKEFAAFEESGGKFRPLLDFSIADDNWRKPAQNNEFSRWIRDNWWLLKELPPEQRAGLNIEPRNVSFGELNKLIQRVENTSEPFLERNDNPGPFSTYTEFETNALCSPDRPVRVYYVKGHDVRIVVPEGYAKSLDEVRKLRLAAEGEAASETDGTVIDRERAKAALAKHELANKVLPEDIIRHLDELPDSRVFKRIVLSDKPNPEEDWARHEKKMPDFVSVMGTYPNKQVWFFNKAERNEFLRSDIFHEAAHRLADDYPLEYQRFHDACELEYRAWGYLPKHATYALASYDEHWAVTGEELCRVEQDRFLSCAQRAPLRTMIYLNALSKSLDRAAADGRAGEFAPVLRNRVEFAKNYVRQNAWVDFYDLMVGPIGSARAGRVRQYLNDAGLGDPTYYPIRFLDKVYAMNKQFDDAAHAEQAAKEKSRSPD